MESLECGSCGARLEVTPQQRTGKCLYCGSPQVINRPASSNRPDPQFAIGFAVKPEDALKVGREWVRKPLFAPTAFRNAKVEEIRGVYLPAFLYTTRVESAYSASIGENYTETQTYTVTVNGKTQTRTRTVVKTEWRHLQGHHAIYVSDHLVTASKGIPNEDLEAIEPYDLKELQRYSPKLVSGWVAEEPTLHLNECGHLARGEALADVKRQLAAFMPGDSHRNLDFRSTFHNESLDLTLLPVWVLPVRYAPDKPPVRLLVNGQSGKIFGKAPTSWVKVGILALVILLVVGAIVLAVVAKKEGWV